MEEALAYKAVLEDVERRLDIEQIARGLTADLAQFMRQAWNIVEPETPLIWNWHYDFLAEWLTLVSDGRFKELHPDKLGLIINVPPRSGKNCAHSEPVFTPDGWRLHGDLRPGDAVFGRNGQPVEVLATGHEQIVDRLVRFTDGGAVRCHAEHEWIVFDRAKGKYPQRILETQQIETGWEPPRNSSVTGPNPRSWPVWLGERNSRGGRARYQVDANVRLVLPERLLAIPPYVLGVWLGDGRSTGACVSHSPRDLEQIAKIESLGFIRSATCKHSVTGVLTTYFKGGLHSLLKRVGVFDDKHIPAAYLTASVNQRLELLAGLVDTDGCFGGEDGRYHFSNCNHRLVEDVATLIRSLGWRACVTDSEPRVEGHLVNGRMLYDRQKQYVASFSPDLILPVAIPRKRSGQLQPLTRRRGIVGIERCAPTMGRCIQVEGGIYLVGETMVPTHNSTFASVLWPIWTWLDHPGRRFLFASHSRDLALNHNNKRAWLIKSRFFQERFANRFRALTTAGDMIRNDHTGQFHVTSIGSGSTGFGGMILVGDDLLDREDAFSVTAKKKANSWIDSSFSKMLDDAVRGVTVHISQRLAVDDPTGHITGEDKSTGKAYDWIRIKIRREATEQETYEFPISGQKFVRPKGDILQADRCPPMVLLRMKAKPREWANQEQQEPTPETGSLLNANRLRWFKGSTPLPTFFQVVISVDCNFAEGIENDFVAIHKYALVFNRRYLIDARVEQMGYAATKQAIKEVARGGQTVAWMSCPMPAATQVLIENKANGPAVTEELRADPNFGLAVIDYNPKGNKTQRFIAATGDVEGGLVYFPEDAYWIGPVRKELCDFAGEGSILHDDNCDAFSQFINWSRQMQYGLLGWLDKQEAAAREQTTHRYEYVNELGVTIVLEWDPAKEMWCGPNGEEFPPAPDEEVKSPDEPVAAQGELGSRSNGQSTA